MGHLLHDYFLPDCCCTVGAKSDSSGYCNTYTSEPEGPVAPKSLHGLHLDVVGFILDMCKRAVVD